MKVLVVLFLVWLDVVFGIFMFVESGVVFEIVGWIGVVGLRGMLIVIVVCFNVVFNKVLVFLLIKVEFVCRDIMVGESIFVEFCDFMKFDIEWWL